MGVGVVAVAAVRVRGIAVRLNNSRVGRGALEPTRPGSEPSGCTCPHVIWQASDIVRVAHEDGGLNGSERTAGERLPCTAAEGVVHDLTALRIPDKHNFGIGTSAIQIVDSRYDSGSALSGGTIVRDTAAFWLAATGRVRDRLRLAARVCRRHHVYKPGRCAIARRCCGLACSEDVHARAALALL